MELNLEQIKATAMAVGGGESGMWQALQHTVMLPDGDCILNAYDSMGAMPEPIHGDAVAAFCASANPAAVLALIEEVERLSAIVEKYIDPQQVMLTDLNVRNGTFDMGLEGGPMRLFAAAFAEYFKESPASNYIEMQLGSTDPEIGDLVCTLQRKRGKTPNDLRLDAERERDSYKRALLAVPPMPAGVLCKGSMALGSGCGRCERCRKEMGK